MAFMNCFLNFNINFAQPRFGFNFGCFSMPNFFTNMPLFNNFSFFSPTSWFQQYYNPMMFNSPSVFGSINNLQMPSVDFSNFGGYETSWQSSAFNGPSFDTFNWSGNNIKPKTKNKRDKHDEFIYDNKNDIYATENANKIEKLDSEMQERTKKLIAYANQNGYDVKITSGYRTQAEQKALQNKYKNQKGRVANNSAHCQGKAIDIKVTKNGQDSDAGYKLLGEYAKSQLNMRWGGDFTTYRERWHFDYDWA